MGPRSPVSKKRENNVTVCEERVFFGANILSFESRKLEHRGCFPTKTAMENSGCLGGLLLAGKYFNYFETIGNYLPKARSKCAYQDASSNTPLRLDILAL